MTIFPREYEEYGVKGQRVINKKRVLKYKDSKFRNFLPLQIKDIYLSI